MTSRGRTAGGAEFDLLCLVLRPNPDLDRIRDALHQGIDHRDLTGLGEAHGVRPALLSCLSDLSWETVPDSERETLELFRQRHLVRALSLSGELHRLAERFAAGGIPFFTFKGPTLALALYGDLALREYNDLDVMVPPRHVEAAEDILVSMDYDNLQGDRAFRRAFLAPMRQYAFTRADGASAIDLHWAFSGRHVPFPLVPDDVWNNPHPARIGDREIPTVAGANLALLLAGHGTKEAWSLLKWSSDFALMIARHPDLDWREVHRRAHARGCGDAVLLASAIVQELLGVAPPEALGKLVAASDRVRARTAALAGRLRAAPSPAPQGENFADLGLCDTRLGRLAGALKLIVTPTAGDHAALKLPRSLWGAYYATRPFRLALNAVTGQPSRP